MCRIAQTPFLFAECRHLCVLATVESCDKLQSSNGLPLYCGPAEWNLNTLTQLQTHPSRCKNCRGVPGGAAAQMTETLAPKTGTASADLVCVVDAGEVGVQDTSTNPVESPKNAQAKKPTRSKKPRAPDAELVELPSPLKADFVVQQATQTPMDDEKMAEMAVKYNVTVEYYKEVFLDLATLCDQQREKREDMWTETPEAD